MRATPLVFALLLMAGRTDSDSDSSIEKTTNRGNKLKKRARYVREGQLTSANGPSSYREASRTTSGAAIRETDADFLPRSSNTPASDAKS